MKSNCDRTYRIADLIQRELAKIMQKEFPPSDKMGWATIVSVEVSKDLAYAKIFVSVLQEEQAEQTLKILNGASGFLRGLLAKNLNLRTTPALRFIFDDSVLRGHQMSILIESCINTKK